MSEGNTLSIDDRELIERHIAQLKRAAIRQCGDACIQTEEWDIADRLESLLSERDKLEEALSEAKLQLEYLESRWPTGTTPPIITRIERALSRTANNG